MAVAERRCTALYSKARFGLFEVRVQNCRCAWRRIFRVRYGAQHHELEVREALAELQGTAGQLRAQRGQRDPVKMARQTILERLYRFGLLLQRLVHLGAEATTSTQGPKLRIVQQRLVPGFEGLC